MKSIRFQLIVVAILLTAGIVFLIWNHNRLVDQTPQQIGKPVEQPIVSPFKQNDPKDLEKDYQRIADELRKKVEGGIGHINPSDALKPDGDVPPEQPMPK
jgi:hypothetical protein